MGSRGAESRGPSLEKAISCKIISMTCKICSGVVRVVFGCRTVRLGCAECGRQFEINDYIDEIDEELWEMISRRPSDRA